MNTKNMIRLPLLALLFIILLLLLSASGIASFAQAADSESNEGGNDLVAYLPVTTAAGTVGAANCRYGGAVTSQDQIKWLESMGVGHFLKFHPTPVRVEIPETVEQLHLIRTKQDLTENGGFLPTYEIHPALSMERTGLGPQVLANPGHLWLVGNEIDVLSVEQDHTQPAVYAEMYHDTYYFIKNLDPYAHVAVAGLSMITPGRLQYWDIVWDAYEQKYGEPMPVDVWNMHNYILAEIRPWDGQNADGKIAIGTDPALATKAPVGYPDEVCPLDDVTCRSEHDDVNVFMNQVKLMRRWMKDHDQQDKPLIISEYSQLYTYLFTNPSDPTTCYLKDDYGQCFSPARVTAFMHKSIDALENTKDPNLGYPADDYRLVQHWTWFSIRTEPNWSGGSSSLLKDGYENQEPGTLNAMTIMGQSYQSRSFNSTHTVNLVAGEALDVKASSTNGTADVPLTVGFYNNGSVAIDKPFKVTFYADAALTKVIDSVIVQPADTGLINGCSWGRIADWVSVDWQDVPAGVHKYWAKVDSNNTLKIETVETDNVVRGQVTIE